MDIVIEIPSVDLKAEIPFVSGTVEMASKNIIIKIKEEGE
jgi:hypothetical protein